MAADTDPGNSLELNNGDVVVKIEPDTLQSECDLGVDEIKTERDSNDSHDEDDPFSTEENLLLAGITVKKEKRDVFDMSEDILLRNARNYKSEEINLTDQVVVKKEPITKYGRTYGRKKLIAQGRQSGSEVLHTTSTSSLQIKLEPQPFETVFVMAEDSVKVEESVVKEEPDSEYCGAFEHRIKNEVLHTTSTSSLQKTLGPQAATTDILLRNARNCKNYRQRKKLAKQGVVKRTANTESCRTYGERKQSLAEGRQPPNEILHTPSISSVKMTLEPQPVTTVKEAKILWRKLREKHRQAICRKKTSTGQAANTKSLWKYEKIMEILLPTMQNHLRATNINTRDSTEDGDVTPLNDDLSESEHYQRAHDFVPPKKKPNLTTIIQNEQKRRKIRSAERDSLRRQLLCSTSKNTTSSIVENTALEKFFMSMLLTTNSLSETLQIKVQRQLFNIVMEAKEEDIATRSSASSSSSASPAANVVRHFRRDYPFQLISTPLYSTLPRTISN